MGMESQTDHTEQTQEAWGRALTALGVKEIDPPTPGDREWPQKREDDITDTETGYSRTRR